MVSHLFYYQLAVLALVWLFVMLHVTGAKPSLPAPPHASEAQAPTLHRAQTVCGPYAKASLCSV